MGIFGILKQLPQYASDIQENLKDIFVREHKNFTKTQLYGLALTVGYSLKHEYLLDSIRSEARMYLEHEDATACKIASVIMSMNNTYFSFSKTSQYNELRDISSDLIMDKLYNHNTDKINFALYCLAASILGQCEYCINVHSKNLINQGVSFETLRDIGKLVAVLKATRDVLEIERMRNYEFLSRDESL